MNWKIFFKKLALGFLTGGAASLPVVQPTTPEGAAQSALIGLFSALTVAGTNYLKYRGT